KSPAVLERALRQPQVAKLGLVRRQDSASAWLARTLQAEFQPNTAQLFIRLSGSDAEELKVLVNAVAQAYVQELNLRASSAGQARQATLRERLEALQQAVAEKRQALQDVKNQPAPQPAPARLGVVRKELQRAATALADLKDREAKVQGELTALQAAARALPDAQGPAEGQANAQAV